MTIESIEFNRSKGAPLELGVLVNGGDGPIIDMAGKVVGECWDYRRTGEHAMTIYLREITQPAGKARPAAEKEKGA